MPKRKVDSSAFAELAAVYNSEGRTAVNRMLEERHGVKCPGSVIRRMKGTPALRYDSASDRFAIGEETLPEPDGVFMSMDELCGGTAQVPDSSQRAQAAASQADAMEKMVHDLIGEKLLELSRYVTISRISKTVLVDRGSLEREGYTLTIQ